MIGPGTGVRVYLACGVTDMRKGIEGLAKALKMRWNASAFTHLRNRLKTESHFPNSPGRSRHGHPVRAIQSTASTKRRGSGPCARDHTPGQGSAGR